MFWRLFGLCGLLLAVSLVVLAVLPASRIPDRALFVGMSALACGLAALALALVRARRILNALQELSQGAERLAEGAYGYKVYVSGPAEVSDLAQTFNRMSERLAGQVTLLEEDRQQLRMI